MIGSNAPIVRAIASKKMSIGPAPHFMEPICLAAPLNEGHDERRLTAQWA